MLSAPWGSRHRESIRWGGTWIGVPPSMCFMDPSPGFLSPGSIDVLCWVVLYPLQWSMFNIILGLCPLDASSICPVVAVKDFFFFVPWEGESPLAENQCLIRVVPPLLMLQIEPIVAAWKPAWPRPLGRPSRWNVWMMWRVSFPWTKQSAPFFHWFGEWVWGDSNVRKKDNAELMEGPGKMLPKDKLEVVAVKFYVLCEYHQGKAGSISDHARLLRGADFSQPNSWVRCDSMPPWGFLNLAAYRKLGMGLENLSSVSLSAWTATEPQLLRRENSCSLSVRMEWNVPEWCSGGRKRSSWLWAGRIECHSIPESP